jgi:hypothetical protein
MKSLLLAVALTAALAIPALAQTKPKAIIVITSAESAACDLENVNVAWIMILRRFDDLSRIGRHYVSSLDNQPLSSPCVVLPVDAPVGTEITVSGILADRGSTDGLAPSVAEGCFNAEAFSVGLATGSVNGVGEINPQDPTNIINEQGYGLFWDETDFAPSTSQHTYTFTVVGCGAGVKCQMPKTIYNTDTGLINNPGCAVLAPLS